MVDLVNLFNPDGNPPQPFVQGILTAFNTSNGNNTVTVQGIPFFNLPILNTGAAINLSAGDVLMLATVNNAYCIVGKISPAGTGEYGQGGVNAGTSVDEAVNFAVGTGFSQPNTVSFSLPSWANNAVVTATAFLGVFNNNASTNYFETYIDIDGQSIFPAVSVTNTIPLNSYGNCFHGYSTITQSGSFTVNQHVNAGAAVTADTRNTAILSATAIFLYIP